jgi:hypothetical protein
MIDFAAVDFPGFERIGRQFLAEAERRGEITKVNKLHLDTCYKFEYAKSGTYPDNFVAVGDARMRVNPTYGQGCGKASSDAVLLDSLLRCVQGNRIPAGFSKQYFKAQSQKLDGMLDFTKAEGVTGVYAPRVPANTTADYGFKSTVPAEGETHAVGAFGRWYSGHIVKICHTQAWLGSTFWLINGGMRPPTDFFAPRVVFAVLKSALLG